jgi:hypothetical protein
LQPRRTFSFLGFPITLIPKEFTVYNSFLLFKIKPPLDLDIPHIHEFTASFVSRFPFFGSFLCTPVRETENSHGRTLI